MHDSTFNGHLMQSQLVNRCKCSTFKWLAVLLGYLVFVKFPKEAQDGLPRLNYHVCLASSLSAVQTDMWMVLAVFAVIRQEVHMWWTVCSTPCFLF